MTTLNIHAQESKSRFSCLSASDPENIPDVRKEIKYQYTTKAQKSNKPWPPARRAVVYSTLSKARTVLKKKNKNLITSAIYQQNIRPLPTILLTSSTPFPLLCRQFPHQKVPLSSILGWSVNPRDNRPSLKFDHRVLRTFGIPSSFPCDIIVGLKNRFICGFKKWFSL